MTRVLSSAQAQAAIVAMQRIINGGLLEQINQLHAQGQILSDPHVWDGRLANDFRSAWPETKRALDALRQQLEELRLRAETINRDIMAAGGNA